MSKNIDFHIVENDLKLFHILSLFNAEKREYRNYLVLFIVCFFCLAVINISTCKAFYTLQERTKKITGNLPAEAMLDASSEMQYDLSVYHNTNFHLYTNSYISTKSSKMVPLIDLDIYSLQPVILTEPLGSGQLVENLIYANLRIQVLIEQYRKLHEKAAMFKSMLPATALDGGTEDAPRLKSYKSRKVQHGVHQRVSEITVEAISLMSTSESTENMDLSRSAGTKATQTDASPSIGSGLSQYADVRDHSYTASTDGRNGHGYEVNDSSAANKKSDPPWISRFLLSVFKYFMNNKIEVVVYFLMLLVLISIFAGAKR